MPQSAIEAPWSPIACKPDASGIVKQVRGYVHWCKDRRMYLAMIVPETVERVLREPTAHDANLGPLVYRTSKSHECRVAVIERDVKRYNGKTHASYAASMDKQEACQHGARYGFEPSPSKEGV